MQRPHQLWMASRVRSSGILLSSDHQGDERDERESDQAGAEKKIRAKVYDVAGETRFRFFGRIVGSHGV